MTDVRLVLVTVSGEEEGVRLARTVVGERLAACANLVPGVRSIYAWKGEIHDDAEWLVLFKTTEAGVEALRARVVGLHSYDCPEVIAIPISAGHAPYLDWVSAGVGEAL